MRIPLPTTLALLAIAVTGSMAFAGSPTVDDKGGKIITPTCPPDTMTWVDLKSSYVFDSKFQRGHDAHGDSLSNEIDLEHRIPIRLFDWPKVDCGQWYLRFGADYTRWDFGKSGHLPLPDTLQSISGVLALEYVVHDAAALEIETRPGVYFEHKVRSQSFDAPTILYFPVYYHQAGDSSFSIILGAYYSDLVSYPILPIGGFVYRTGKWTVRAVVPEPRISYQVTDRLGLFAAGQLTGGGYSTDTHRKFDGTNLNDATVQYDEYRALAGFSYKMSVVTAEVGAGYAFERKFDYFRARQGFQTDQGAPVVQAELRMGF